MRTSRCSTRQRLRVGLREQDDPRRAISVSFRSRPRILAFVNDVFDAIEKAPERADRFRYEETDRFPLEFDEAPASAADAAKTSLAGFDRRRECRPAGFRVGCAASG